MSNEAMTWALRDAPDVPSHAVAVLIGLANHANENGRGAYPSQKLLGKYARKQDRQVRKDLAALEEAKLIRRGDQRLAAHIPADRRPVVWDLAMDSVARETAGPTGPAGPRRPVAQYRPDPDDRSSSAQRPVLQDRLTVIEPKSTTSGSAQARPPARPPRPRGTRIPEDFRVTTEMRAWFDNNIGNTVDGRRETEKFRNYWRAKTGQSATKLDWEATWRNWMLKAADSR